MDIQYLGHACFKIKGKNATIVTDPFDPHMVGLSLPKNLTADIVTISHQHNDHNFVQGLQAPNGTELVTLEGPGEYEVKGVEIAGMASFHDPNQGRDRGDNTIFKIDIDGVKVVHLGDLGHILTEAQVELIDEVDILLIPVGGTYTITAKEAAKVINQLEPAIVVPMHFQRPGLKEDLFKALSPLADFLKEMGRENIASQPKLKLTRDDLPEEMEIVVLE